VAAFGDDSEVDAEVAGFAVLPGDEVEQLYVAIEHRGTGVSCSGECPACPSCQPANQIAATASRSSARALRSLSLIARS
jgi:hypothetical protein